MNTFIEELAKRKAQYYFFLYKSNKRAERRDDCVKRIRMIDEYTLLLDLIEYLPVDRQQHLNVEYTTALDLLTIQNS